MQLSPAIWPIGVIAILIAATLVSPSSAEEPILVEFVSGGSVEAMLDSRTDRERLWLTTAIGNSSLAQSIPWENVRQMKIDGRCYEGRTVRTAIAILLDSSSDRRERSASGLHRLNREVTASGSWLHVKRQEIDSRPAPTPRVQAMTVSAWLENWDGDVNPDGLMVELTPFGQYGDPIPVDGTATFSLQSWKTSGRDRHLEVRPEKWSRTVRSDEFGSGSVLFRLPFRSIQPHASSEWWSRGVLQIRLVVPGAGVLERTLTDLRLRHAEPMRDTWELYTGQRHLPGENNRRHAWSLP